MENFKRETDVLECGIDDFIDYEKVPNFPFYIDKSTDKIAFKIFENSEHLYYILLKFL